jgi:hypothetical protein
MPSSLPINPGKCVMPIPKISPMSGLLAEVGSA